MVPDITDIMVPGFGSQVIGAGDGRTTGGEESGTGDIGGAAIKLNFSRMTPGSYPGS